MNVIITSIIGAAIGFAILFLVIHVAVRNALFHHYKVVRWYEATGEWRTNAGHWKEAPTPIGSVQPKKLN